MFKISIALSCTVIALAIAVPDENKWVWNEDGEPRNRDEKRARFTHHFFQNRYLVDEFNEHPSYQGNNPYVNYRPQYSGFHGSVNRPIKPPFHGPNPEILVGPGGPTGIVNRPHGDGIKGDIHNQGGSHYQDFETCKCTYNFNCPSTGLSFGSCSKGKRYCCYNINKFPSPTPAENPSRVSHASYPERPNFGPVNFSPEIHDGRPQGNFHGDYQSDLGGHYRPDDINYGRPYGERPYGLDRYENQRPFRPYEELDFYARSANKDSAAKGDVSSTRKSKEKKN